MCIFPVIDPIATGQNIKKLRREKGLSVRDLQNYFGFEDPQAIYKWQWGKSLPSVDNLYALSVLLETPIERILVPKLHTAKNGQQAGACCPYPFLALSIYHRLSRFALNHWFRKCPCESLRNITHKNTYRICEENCVIDF